MPLPDAPKKSPRVYTLLQNTDLENVTFADIASIGNPVSVEELNEDTLRRLVLVNVARMCIAGEWTGLLTAAGGGDSGYGVLQPITEVGAYDGFEISGMAPWGLCTGGTTTVAAPGYPQAYPFVSPKSGALSEIVINVHSTSAASTLVVAIYEQDATTHMPSTMLGYVTFDTASATGDVSATSFSGGTPNLTAGTQYWLGYARGSSSYATLKGISEEFRLSVGPSSGPTNRNNQGTFVGNWNTANPVDTIGTLNQYVSGATLCAVLKW